MMACDIGIQRREPSRDGSGKGIGVGKGLVRLELNFTGKRGEEEGAEGTTCRQIQELFNHLKIEMVKLKKS